MTYLGKVVKIIDPYTIVATPTESSVYSSGKEYLIVGMGEEIQDPDTGESLGRLEVVRGIVKVEHKQDKLITMKSSRYTRSNDQREIKKIKRDPRSGGIATWVSGGGTEEIETITPGESRLNALDQVEVGDKIKALA